ncbi:hypothetical protein C8J57DRAFT_1251827 [Mycena rebaudengoi]|nr:hypothetical protein C8J57DRAFT_1251827 [Mycena rebaudengoi]
MVPVRYGYGSTRNRNVAVAVQPYTVYDVKGTKRAERSGQENGRKGILHAHAPTMVSFKESKVKETLESQPARASLLDMRMYGIPILPGTVEYSKANQRLGLHPDEPNDAWFAISAATLRAEDAEHTQSYRTGYTGLGIFEWLEKAANPRLLNSIMFEALTLLTEKERQDIRDDAKYEKLLQEAMNKLVKAEKQDFGESSVEVGILGLVSTEEAGANLFDSLEHVGRRENKEEGGEAGRSRRWSFAAGGDNSRRKSYLTQHRSSNLVYVGHKTPPLVALSSSQAHRYTVLVSGPNLGAPDLDNALRVGLWFNAFKQEFHLEKKHPGRSIGSTNMRSYRCGTRLGPVGASDGRPQADYSQVAKIPADDSRHREFPEGHFTERGGDKGLRDSDTGIEGQCYACQGESFTVSTLHFNYL